MSKILKIIGVLFVIALCVVVSFAAFSASKTVNSVDKNKAVGVKKIERGEKGVFAILDYRYGEIEFAKPKKIINSQEVKIPLEEPTDFGDSTEYFIDVLKFGSVRLNDGKESGELLLIQIASSYPDSCKESVRLDYCYEGSRVGYCDQIETVNAVRRGEDLVLLAAPEYDVGNQTFNISELLLEPEFKPFLKSFGIKNIAVDKTFVIPELVIPEEIPTSAPNAKLKFRCHIAIEPNKQYLTNILTHNDRQVYTTKADLAPDILKIYDLNYQNKISENSYLTNDFFTFLPNGIRSVYVHYFPLNGEYQYTRKSDGGSVKINLSDYYSSHRSDPGFAKTYDAQLNPTIFKDGDLKLIGSDAKNGYDVYQIVPSSKLYVKLYNEYLSYVNEHNRYRCGEDLEDCRGDPSARIKLHSYDRFIDSAPLLVLKDVFGRLIRLVRNDVALPSLAEPIIYLYPTKKTDVKVKFGQKLLLTASEPKYNRVKGWNLSAEPNGSIADLQNGKKYRYLFWEGISGMLPPPKKGFIVKKAEVDQFFREKLAYLNLSDVEINDFLEASKVKISPAPYYLIKFIDPEMINKLAPLYITPKPDVLLRVLVDFVPFEELPKDIVEDLSMPKPVERRGFTAVEWGIVQR